ncbi:CobW family GTP-binding protein [Budvicia diplopodorum]|uniref:CobW family GTP-binding protein n=1 Tax=Budvicia diplopodorum TaxID=1119056 RepID=UPI00135788CB|nr:GTP-binding protein [Budvicia diplopodorum]
MTKTNLITGFLGSGKTTTIQHLLRQKPANENWAILVNEFGEIGIDGTLLSNQGATLKEIPGGCMCCVNGLPMPVGLNMLLKQAKPDRLLIEPTGLGHPKQILSLLTSEFYQPLLDLRATLCLVDARQLQQQRYYENENFRDQLASADIILASKSDTYTEHDTAAFIQWHQNNALSRPYYLIEQGNVPTEILDNPRLNLQELPDGTHHHHVQKNGLAALSLPGGQGWRRALNQGQGYFSCGWIFEPETCFSTGALLDWVRLSPVERVKGIMRIPEGTMVFNRQGLDLKIETQPVAPVDSRVELIHSAEAPWNHLQLELLKARINKS